MENGEARGERFFFSLFFYGKSRGGCVESGGGYGVFFSTKNERRKREKRDGPTLTKQAVRLHRQLAFFSLSLSLIRSFSLSSRGN